MKNFTLVLLGLFAAASCAGAEVIDSVVFNPARLGQYERLKVSDGLTSHGGVQTQSMAVQTSGAASVTNEGNYKIPHVQVNGSLHMPATRFETPELNSRGGTAYFDEAAGTDVQSHIDGLTQTALRVKANVLDVRHMTVQATPSGDYDGNTIQGLKLGGNDIAAPSVPCRGLDWFERTASDGNKYKLLGFGVCMQNENPLYGPDIHADNQFTSDTCPGGDEETRSQTRFLCEQDPKYKGQCVDLFNSYFHFSYEDTYATTDTCTGNTVDKFYKTMQPYEKYHKFSCIDVYKETSASAEAVKSTLWRCDGNYVKYDGAVVNGPDALDIECPCKYSDAKEKCLVKYHRTDMCIHSGSDKPECYGSNTTFTNGGVNPSSSISDICSYCTGSCERVLVVDQIPGCPASGLFNCPNAPSRWPVSYRWVNCKTTKARKVIYKRMIDYRKVDCSGGGDVEGTAPEDKGA